MNGIIGVAIWLTGILRILAYSLNPPEPESKVSRASRV